MELKTSKLEDIYDRIEAEEAAKMSPADGYQWGLDYLQDILLQIKRLERLAMEKNDPALYNNVQLSLQRAMDAKRELQEKIGSAKKHA